MSKLCSDPGGGWGLVEEGLKLPIRDICDKRSGLYVQSTSKKTKQILCPGIIIQIRHLAKPKAA